MISITKNTYHKFEPFLYFRIPIFLYIFYCEKLLFYILYIIYLFTFYNSCQFKCIVIKIVALLYTQV